jgi:peptide/nickel transport system permease protein
MGEKMSSGKRKRSRAVTGPVFALKRTAGLFSVFVRNTRGLIGLIIVLVFVIVALFPSAFAPYDPVNADQLSGYLGAPTWLVSLPPQLGGRPGLSQNMYPIENPGFEGLTGWNVTESPHISVEHLESFNNHSDVLHLSVRRDAGEAYGNISAGVFQTFYYPYAGSPFSFRGQLTFFLNGTSTTTTKIETYKNASNPGQYPKPTRRVNVTTFDVPMRVVYYLQNTAANLSFPMWPLRRLYTYTPPGMQGMTKDDVYVNASALWVDSSSSTVPIDSYSQTIAVLVQERYGPKALAIQNMFPTRACPGNYSIGVEVTFLDTNASKPVSADIYLDTTNFWLFGNSFGLMGTDARGRDLWSQLIYGARISLYVGLLSSIMAVVIGLVVGLMAGYLGRFVDELLMRICDVLLVLPGLPLLVVLMAVLGATIDNLIIILGALGWMGFARLVRSQVISLKERPFIEAAKAVGASKTHIMLKHVLPNVMSLVYVSMATTVPGNIVAEASLGFLGFTDPNRMSWGLMLNNMAEATAYQNWWWVVPPGLAIATIAIAFILFGYALDEILNPRLRLRR